MRVVLIHAYSTTNSGDGLLVEEAAEIVREAFPQVTLELVALDPASFDREPFDELVHPLTGRTSGIPSAQTLLRGIGLFLTRRHPRRISELIAGADLVVAVGGGYLRTKSITEAIKTTFAHYVQLPTRRDPVPFVYLPQSIGPLNVGTRRLYANRLRRAFAVVVRDDRSLAQLGGLHNLHRLPDMALLGLPAEWDPSTTVAAGATGPVGLVARELSSSRPRVEEYRAKIAALHAGGMEYLAQATSRGNNDLDFYRSLGFQSPVRLLKDTVAAGSTDRPGVVVSVRLHGSIQTIRSGVPSVHLSYERKGWGAYEDLGISRFVHNAFSFDPAVVLEQVAELQRDPSEYWAAVGGAVDKLRDDRAELVGILRSATTSRKQKA